jgi:hypothetical protein
VPRKGQPGLLSSSTTRASPKRNTMLTRPIAQEPQTSNTSPVVIIAHPLGHGRFDAYLEGGFLAHATATPFLSACRRLVALGFDPDRLAILRHVGSATDSLTAKIEVAAKLTVEDSDRIRFRHWSPLSYREGSPPIAPLAPAHVGHRVASANATAEVDAYTGTKCFLRAAATSKKHLRLSVSQFSHGTKETLR